MDTPINLFKVYMSKNASRAAEKVLNSGYIGQGPVVEQFEKDLKNYFDNDYLLSVNAGTSALHLAIHLLKTQGCLTSDDEVLTTPMTCLYGNSQVLLPDGKTMFINSMVHNRYDGYVMSYNVVTNKLEPKKVINWYKSPIGDRHFIRLTHEKSSGKKSIIDKKNGVWLTNDHKILTNRGYIEADKLNENEPVFTKFRKLNNEQEKALYGMMLGDGGIRIHVNSKNITTARYYYAHVFTQEDYGDYKASLLKGIFLKKSHKNAYKRSKASYVWMTKTSPYFYDIYNEFYVNGIKNLPFNFSKDNLSELGLAIWFMDDGYFSKKYDQYSVFSSESFSVEDNKRLQNILLEKFDLKSTLIKKKDKMAIHLNKNQTKKLFSIIGRYIVPTMRYKLSDDANKEYPFDANLWNIGESEPYLDRIKIINGVPSTRTSHLRSVYCIDVEDNHNFISGGLILHNCTATNWPILANGLRIKWVDINDKNLNIDLDDLQRKITPKTKIIMLVHWGGYPVDLDEIRNIQESAYNMYGFRPMVIEDCAHAFGSSYKGKLIGNHGNLNAFSFQAIKHLTTVDGGMLILPNENLYKRGKLVRWYGIDRDSNRKDFRCEADIEEWGFKFHMNDVNASIGIENLKEVDDIIIKHQENAKYYDDNLKDVDGLTLLERKEDRQSSFWIYSMLVDKRADFMEWMKECGIIVSQVHERNDRHSAMREYRSHLPTLDKTVRKIVSIPVGWWVTEEQREYIAECIKKGW